MKTTIVIRKIFPQQTREVKLYSHSGCQLILEITNKLTRQIEVIVERGFTVRKANQDKVKVIIDVNR